MYSTPLFAPIRMPESEQPFLKGFQNVQQLQQEQLKNALLSIQKQYMPQMQEAEIGEKQGRTQNYLAEASMAPSRIGLMNSQAGHYNALTKSIPEELDIKRAQLQQQNQRFGTAYQMARMLNAMPQAARATWIAQNQDAYNQMLAELGNGGMRPSNALNNQEAPTEAPNALTQSSPSSPRFLPPTPEQNAQIAKANQMAANKALSTAATERQMEGAIQVENIVNDPGVQQQVVNASQYAGAVRKGKAALDALSQKNPAAYEDYLAFKNQTQVLLQNRIKTLDQMGATDKQREELEGLYSKTMDSLTSNPSQFITQFNKLGKTLDTIARSVQKSASPIAKVNRLEGYKEIPDMNDRVTVVAPDGRSGSIPSSQLQEALKAGYREG